MCNEYASEAEIMAIHEALDDLIGTKTLKNLRSYPALYPDSEAPIIRIAAGGGEIATARWGMPSPAFALQGKKTDRGVTNIRNTASPHWRRWLGVERRCLVPFTRFCEPETLADGSKAKAWFAWVDDRPVGFFAGIWTPWTSVRKVKEGEVTCDLYGFLTTDANAEVAAVHPKAMPVILQSREDMALWLTAPTADALTLQRPLPDGALRRFTVPDNYLRPTAPKY